MARTCFIIWNKARSEAYVTEDYADAVHASGGRRQNFCSTLADNFREYQTDGRKLEIEKIEVEK